MRPGEYPSRPGVPFLVVELPDGRLLRFTDTFHVGRDSDCDVQIDDVRVSRRHAVVSFAGGRWSIRDLQSSNGLFVDGERVETAAIDAGVRVVFGLDGPSVWIGSDAAPKAPATRIAEKPADDAGSLESYADRYFTPTDDGPVGARTIMIRRAFQAVQQQQKRKHRTALAVVALAGLCVAGYAYYEYLQVARLEALAETMFYRIRASEVAIAASEEATATSGRPIDEAKAGADRNRQRQAAREYEQYVKGLYDRRLTPEEQLILRVTRSFGECELMAPKEYVQIVKQYIGSWRSTGRFARAVRTAEGHGYTRRIVEELMKQHLPPEFFYLAMQESSFDPLISGKPTHWGIAKGMWQFIPETGERYGLQIGPLKDSSAVDTRDERLDWEKATVAAAKYIKFMYATDAQASGLLVIASYNWGERRVIDMVKKLPENPRERNFWKLLEAYPNRLPPETYHYVFSIVSAAAIGENPRLFGFDFDSPLKFVRDDELRR